MRECFNERRVFAQGLPQILQRFFGQEEKRLGSHQLKIAFEINVDKQVRLALQLERQPLDKLPVLVLPLAFNNSHQAVLKLELLFQHEKILLVLFMRRDQIAAIRAEPEMRECVSNSASQQDELRENEPPGIRLEAGGQRVPAATG